MELSASEAEDWATQAFLAISRGGVELPEDAVKAGLAGVAALGQDMFKGLAYYEVKPLMDKMMECVQFIPDPARPKYARDLVESDIEEVRTRLMLRREVVKLHLDFSPPAAA